jgi:hypothetical protein
MGDRSQTDKIWELGENIYPRFVYMYCKCSKKGGGVTCFKQHLADRGTMSSIVHVFHPTFVTIFDVSLIGQPIGRRASKRKKLLREEVPAKGNVVHDTDFDDEELQRALHASREEE